MHLLLTFQLKEMRRSTWLKPRNTTQQEEKDWDQLELCWEEEGSYEAPEMPERKHRALCKEPNRNFSGSRTLLPAAHARFWSQLAVVS